jgi:uncharacterized SAM-binding protein YcdF (DUF218 family)
VKRRLRLSVAAVIIVAALAILSRSLWLPLPAKWLQLADAPRPADAMMVLSGQSLWRARKAAQLFHDHYAPRVLVSGGDIDEYFGLLTNERVYDAELQARVLARLGVPRDAMVLVNGMKSTRDEALAFRQYAREHPLRSVILVTSHLHSRRARWAFRHALGGVPIDVMAVEADQPHLNARDWWRHPDAALGVLNEYLKFGYYVGRF